MRLFSILLGLSLLACISAYGDTVHEDDDKGILSPAAEPSAPTRPRRPYTGQLSPSFKSRPTSTPAPKASTRPSYSTPSQVHQTPNQPYHAHSLPFYGAPSQQPSYPKDQDDDKRNDHQQQPSYQASTHITSAPRPIYSQSSYTINLEPYQVAASKHRESGYYPISSHSAPSLQPQHYRPQTKAPTPSYGSTTLHTPTKTSYEIQATHSYSTTSRPLETPKPTRKPSFIPAYQPVRNLYPIHFVPFAPSKPTYHQREEHHQQKDASSSEDRKKQQEEKEEEEEEDEGDEDEADEGKKHHKQDSRKQQQHRGYGTQFDRPRQQYNPRVQSGPSYRGQQPFFSAIPVQVPIITSVRPHPTSPAYRPKTVVKTEEKPKEPVRPQYFTVQQHHHHHHQSSYQQQQQSRPVYQQQQQSRPVHQQQEQQSRPVHQQQEQQSRPAYQQVKVHIHTLPTYQTPVAPAYKIEVPAIPEYQRHPPSVSEYRPQTPAPVEYRPATPATVDYRPATPETVDYRPATPATVDYRPPRPATHQQSFIGYQTVATSIQSPSSIYQVEGSGQIGELASKEEVYPDDLSAIPGEPGKDYPQMIHIPESQFTCENKLPGFYADVETQCQVWHICDTDGRKESFLCPNGTIYHQAKFVCDWWYNVDCSRSVDFYGVNAQLYIIPTKKEVDAPQYEIKSQGPYETSQVQESYPTIIPLQTSYVTPVPSVPAIAVNHQSHKSPHYAQVSQTRPVYGFKKQDSEEENQSQNTDY